jgi:phage terminase large subunit GpA-like protein
MTVKTRRGFTRLEWQKSRERNEALDCRVYARAVAWIAGIDRWTERKWQELERQLGIEAEAKPVPAMVSESAGQRTRADILSGRRAIRSRWLGGRPRNWLQRG